MSDPTGDALRTTNLWPGRVALVFGVTGQDGSYLSELLLDKGYKVVGVSRRTSTPNDRRVRHLYASYPTRFSVVAGDVTDACAVNRVLNKFYPSEIYNLAAQSNVARSFDEPVATWQATACGALHVLEWMRAVQPSAGRYYTPRFYQASSSEMFGSMYTLRVESDDWKLEQHLDWVTAPVDGHWLDELRRRHRVSDPHQCERTPMRPNSPYAVAKLAAHHLCRVYRESYGVFACSGVLFNHESPRRGEDFVTRKITRYVARRQVDPSVGPLGLGNLEARRDWGWAPDFVRAMWLMLQRPVADDFVIATGQTRSVRDFLHAAFAAVGVGPEDAELHVRHDATMLRPCEVPYLRGDASRAVSLLGWRPETPFEDWVRCMVYAEKAESP